MDSSNNKLQADIRNATEYILNIPKFAAKIGTENLSVLLEILGNPHLKMKTIHVAGTNGKGSVTNMLRNMLTYSGYKAGAFISPHLNKINERISIDGEDISDSDFLECYEIVRKAIVSLEKKNIAHPSFFEFVFAMAAVYFSKKNVDYVVFETGMGGRLDATNVIIPEISVITSIGLDHIKYLGDSIEKIAYEKAGIIKENTPVIYNTGNKNADYVIEKRAKECNAPLFCVENSKVIINEISGNGIDFSIENSYYSYYSIKLGTGALYQTDNANTAILAFYVLMNKQGLYEEKNFYETIKKALLSFYWPGRMEYIRDNILIDGAHNEDAAIKLEKSVRELLKKRKVKRLKLLFAVANDKDYDSIIRIITRNILFDTIYITEINSVRMTDTHNVLEIFMKYLPENCSTKIVTGESSEEVLITAEEALDKDDLLLCMGSLYLVAEIKAHYKKEKL